MKVKNIFIIIITLVFLLFCLYTYALGYNYRILLNEKFYIKYLIFNFVFICNILFMFSEKLSKYWFLAYFAQLVFLLYVNRNRVILFDIENIIVLYCIFHILMVVGISVKDKMRGVFKNRYENGIIAQNNFYKNVVKKVPLLNDIIFFRNVFAINLGAMEVPKNYTFGFWFLQSVMLLLVGILSWNFAYKTAVSIAVFCFSINAIYDTLYHNYRDSEGFRDNFNENKKVWLAKIQSNYISKPGAVIKRYYGRVLEESIKLSADNLGSITMTNPRTRTLMFIGGTFICVSGVLVLGATGNTFIKENAVTERHKLTVQADVDTIVAEAEKAKAEAEKAKAEAEKAKAEAEKVKYDYKKWKAENESKGFFSKRLFS